MCNGTANEWMQLLHYFPKKQTRVRMLRFSRARKLQRGKKLQEGKYNMKLKNLKLYMENMTIIQENEKLRKQAILLHQENLALISQINQNRLLNKEN